MCKLKHGIYFTHEILWSLFHNLVTFVIITQSSVSATFHVMGIFLFNSPSAESTYVLLYMGQQILTFLYFINEPYIYISCTPKQIDLLVFSATLIYYKNTQ